MWSVLGNPTITVCTLLSPWSWMPQASQSSDESLGALWRAHVGMEKLSSHVSEGW